MTAHDAPAELDPRALRRIDRVGRFYVLVAVLLVPWILYLLAVLPSRRLTVHYDLAWVGFDAVLAIALLTTGVLVVRRSPAVVLPAAGTAALLLTDAWFDVVTATQGGERLMALVLAVVAEVPLAGLSVLVAVRVLHRLRSAADRPLDAQREDLQPQDLQPQDHPA